MTAYVDNDNVFEIDGLRDVTTAAYINDATITVTLEDEGGTEVPGETWPLTLIYVGGSLGVYRTMFTADLPLVAGQTYVAQVSADTGAEVASWSYRFKPKVRNV